MPKDCQDFYNILKYYVTSCENRQFGNSLAKNSRDRDVNLPEMGYSWFGFLDVAYVNDSVGMFIQIVVLLH